MPVPETEVSRLLYQWREGDPRALERLAPLVYEELRRLAGRYLRSERTDHSLDATDLVHEAYLRMVDKSHPNWRDRIHFFAVAAQQMRRVLIDPVRRHRAGNRGGGMIKLPIDREVDASSSPESTDLVALHEALEQLAELDPRKAKVVELRYFGGMSLEETAEFLQVSSATVINDARFARAWLHRELSRGARDRPS